LKQGGNDSLVQLGEVLKPHGIDGRVKVSLHLPARLHLSDLIGQKVILGDKAFVLEDALWMNKYALVNFRGVESLSEAEALRKLPLYLSRQQIGQLEDNEFYLEDLVELELVDEGTGELVGSLKDFEDIPGNPLIKIQRPNDKSLLLPFNEAFIGKIDLMNGKIFLREWKNFSLD